MRINPINQNQQKKYASGYKGGGLKKGEVNELRAKVIEQAETIQVLNHIIEQETQAKKEAELLNTEVHEVLNAFNNSSFLDKLFFILSGKTL